MDQFDKELMEATEQGSEKWLSDRVGRFTASEMHKLMGEPKSKSEKWSVAAYTYILEKVAEEITGLEKFTPDNYAMAWGKENEPVARDLYCKLQGLVRIDVPGFIPYVVDGIVMGGASPDGLAVLRDDIEQEYSPYGVEIKCPSVHANHIEHLLIDSDEYFKKYFKEYYWQCQMGMLCSKRESWEFISYQPHVKGLELFKYRLKKNADDHELMHIKIIDAWKEKEEIKTKLLKL